MTTKSDQWACGLCGKHFVVPILARECELKHLTDKVQDTKRPEAHA